MAIRDFKQRERGRRRGLQNPQKDWGEDTVVAAISKQLSSHLMFLTCLFFFFIEVRRHDAAMLADFNLLQDMQRYAFSPGLAGHPLCVLETPITH